MDEVETMFSARELPWHRKGTVTPDALTAEDAIVAAGLDWEVVKEPAELKGKPVPGYYFTVRSTDEHVLGSVRAEYVPFQNRDAFRFADNLVDSGEAKYETAGSLRNGKWVWLTMKMPEHILVGGQDEHELYLLLNSSHDGSKRITVSVTPIRVVCMNTLNLALGAAHRTWGVRHISTAGARLEEARQALKLTFKYVATFQEEAERLLAEAFSDTDMDALLELVLEDKQQKPKVAAAIKGLFTDGPTLENVRGTKWAALNAIGEYFDWTREPKTADSQLQGSLFGGTAMKHRDKALTLLRAA